LEYLSLRGVDLFLPMAHLSFVREAQEKYADVSAGGKRIEIDQDDDLWYSPHRWWHKRLYTIPHVAEDDAGGKHSPGAKRLAVNELRWLPSEKYVIMKHHFFGILILEPSTGKIGILDNQRGGLFGWYSPVSTGKVK